MPPTPLDVIVFKTASGVGFSSRLNSSFFTKTCFLGSKSQQM